MNIAILATASFQSGALTIYRQLLSYLGTIENKNNIYIFIEESMPTPEIQNVTYIKIKRQSWPRRIYWLLFWIKSWANKQGIFLTLFCLYKIWELILLVNRLSTFIKQSPCTQLNGIFFKKEERLFFLYKYIYPIFIKIFSKKSTIFITQTKCIKNRLGKNFTLTQKIFSTTFPM